MAIRDVVLPIKRFQGRIPPIQKYLPLAEALSNMPEGKRSTWWLDAGLEKLYRDRGKNLVTLDDVMRELQEIKRIRVVEPTKLVKKSGKSKMDLRDLQGD